MEILVAHKVRSNLQEWIDDAGLNYTAVAFETGVDIGAIKRYAKNQFDRVDCASWQAICTSFKRPLSDLFYEDKS